MPASASPSRSLPPSTSCRGTRRRGGAGIEPLPQRPQGAAAMADRILLLVRELGHRQPRRVRRAVVWQEGRVVAEAALAAGLGGQAPAAAALEEALDARARIHVGDRA